MSKPANGLTVAIPSQRLPSAYGASRVRRVPLAGVLLLAISLAIPSGSVGAPSAPAVSTDIARECAALDTYFLQVAHLTRETPVVAALQQAGNDVLAFGNDDLADAVAALDGLIAEINAIRPPDPARQWQSAYLALLVWYRDMAANRDPDTLQHLINADRRLFVNLATAYTAGSFACPDTWDAAWNDAFVNPEASPVATPVRDRQDYGALSIAS